MKKYLKLDWLSFTFHAPLEFLESYGTENEFYVFSRFFPEIPLHDVDYNVPPDPLRPLTGNRTFKEINANRLNYDHVYSCGNFCTIRFCDTLKAQGVNVQISSSGLVWWFDLFGLDPDDEDSVAKMLQIIKCRFCKFSRIDICYDDYTKRYTPHDYNKLWVNGYIASRSSKYSFIASQQKEGGTFYLGSRSTGKLMRIYDKAFESRLNDPDNFQDCIRYEFELHKDYANGLVDFILDNGSIPFCEYILSNWFYVMNKPKTDSNNYSREHMDISWFEFLVDELSLPLTKQSIKISKKKRSTSLDSESYFFTQVVVPAFLTHFELYGLDACESDLSVGRPSASLEKLLLERDSLVC